MRARLHNQIGNPQIRAEGKVRMASYLLQVSYTPQAWAALLKNPHDRTEVLRPVLAKLGGSFQSAYFAFGDYDVIAVMDLPQNVDAAAFSIAAAAGGAIRAIKTTPLMSIADGIAAMQKAGQIGYVAPAGSAGV
jgi:uncharacterized protein with GYD domain